MNITSGIILAYLTLMVVAAKSKNIRPRILSFKLSPDTYYRFQGVIIFKQRFSCTASLITEYQVLVVASCIAHIVKQPEVITKVKVRVGSIAPLQGTTYHVRRISHHPDFAQIDRDFYIHDIAVVHMRNKINISTEVGPINLPSPNSKVLSQVLVLLSAFARTKTTSQTILPLLMRILTNTETIQQCQGSFATLALNKGQVCIEINPEFRYGPCDVGGPMLDVGETTIFGLASSGWKRNGAVGIPKIFTKVSEHLPYILEEISYGTPSYSTTNPPPAVNWVAENNNTIY